MKRKKRILDVDRSIYELYQDTIDYTKVFAINKSEYQKIKDLKAKYETLFNVPDEYTVKCIQVKKTNEIIENKDVWRIINKSTIDVKINDIDSMELIIPIKSK